ncbi:MAG: hypothetical protein EXS08_00125 [Planctomycetes bacterium]|nr:hypothetical protein [Planctomycetota bacterium]
MRVELQRARELLASGKPLEVLAHIVAEDGLALRPRLGARLGARALLCDGERVLLCAQALCALRAKAGRGAPELGRWLDEQVEEALAALTQEGELGPEALEALVDFATPLVLDPGALAVGCARFNRLPFEQREAFFALVLDGASPDRLARERGLALPELLRRARGALEPFLRPTAAPLPPQSAR